MSWYGFRPYVPVAKRRSQAAAFAAKLAKKEKRSLAPVRLEGRAIAASFWGKAWCENLEGYSDFANRLPRGRTYVRNGSVIDLQMQRGKVKAIVSGSQIYQVTISIKTLPETAWSHIKKDCSGSIDSLIDLLQGRFDQGIMQRLSRREGGLFPRPQEIDMDCSCPDWAGMCKHVAAVLYGVGARLDSAPELLFTLRDVDHLELLSQAVDAGNLNRSLAGSTDAALAGSDLGEMFGIDLDVGKETNAAAAPAKVGVSPALSASRPRGNKKPPATPGQAKQVIRPRLAVRKVARALAGAKKSARTQRERKAGAGS